MIADHRTAIAVVMLTLENIISDRGSKYAVSGGTCRSANDAEAMLKQLTRTKKFAKATHNSWGVILDDGPLKNNDGDAGAGMIILQMLERENLHNHLVVVTRWYGGKHLGGDRFKHVKSSVRTYLDRINRAD